MQVNIFEQRNQLDFQKNSLYISREYFEKHFTKTKETIEFSFNGWDGRSYNGESRKAKVLKCDLKNLENLKFIKFGKAVCYIDEETKVLEKVTNKFHCEACWFVDVLRKEK